MSSNQRGRAHRRVRVVGALLGSTVLASALLANGTAFADGHELAAENKALKQKVESLAKEVEELKALVMKNAEMVKSSGGPPDKMVKSGNDKVSLSVSGQVNRMLFYADDGDQARFFHADNDQSSTRVRWKASADIDEDISAGALVEVQFESNSTADVTIDQNKSVIGSNSFTERKLEVFFEHDKLGKLTLGQGSTASDGAAEEDLSPTGIITSAGYAGTGESLGFVLSGTNGTQSGTTVGDLFDNFDGLSRDDRLRYDTPTFAGFQASTSWVDGDEWDVALRYGRDFDGFEVVLAAAYWDAQSTDDKTGWAASGSVLAPFGTSLSGTYSTEDQDFVAATAAGGGQADLDPEFWYVKLGQQFDALSIGTTAISIDYSETEDQSSEGNEGTFYSLAVSQDVDAIAGELYGIVGQYEADIPNTSTEDITIGGVGARVKF